MHGSIKKHIAKDGTVSYRVRFKPGNAVPYGQDVRRFRGIPQGVIWDVEVDETAPGTRYRLIADGYGYGIPGRPAGRYGNGALHIDRAALDAADALLIEP